MEKLFTNGDGSNFTIVIKSDSFKDEPKTMKLHKNFLCQMSYFQALFGAQWAETDREMMEINLTDANISQKCKSLFSRFYELNDKVFFLILSD